MTTQLNKTRRRHRRCFILVLLFAFMLLIMTIIPKFDTELKPEEPRNKSTLRSPGTPPTHAGYITPGTGAGVPRIPQNQTDLSLTNSPIDKNLEVPTAPPYEPLRMNEIESVFKSNVSAFVSSASTHAGQEPPHFDYGDGPKRYHNPYRPMHRTERPCNGESLGKGRWVYNSSKQPPYAPRGIYLGCCDRNRSPEEGIRKDIQYEWVPDTCDVVPWDEELFCRSLRGRSIMLVGDSLNEHWHASLFYLLGGSGDVFRRENSENRKCNGHIICQKYYPNNSVRLSFMMNQFLDIGYNRGFNFLWWKDIHRYEILILNAGAWMVKPGKRTHKITDDDYYLYMRQAASIVRRLYKGTVIWRTTFRGIPNCWKYDKPLERPLLPHEYTVPGYTSYRWNAIPARNVYTKALWRDMGAHILDIAPMMDLMPLGRFGKKHPMHRRKGATDCLHFCSPGPAYDQWSLLLMNLLIGNIDN